MSYSFNFTAATKAEAKAQVEAEFDKIIGYQPIHARDKAAAIANANAVIDLLADDDSKDIAVACNGYLSWQVPGDGSDAPGVGAAITASASHSIRN